MNNVTQFLVEHGTPILFVVVLVEHVGLPLPLVPWLLAAGALAAAGEMNPVAAITVTALACLIADSAWFYIGRRSGKRMLNWLGRMSLDPTGARRTEGFLTRHTATGLLGAKFLGWVGMLIPPLAGTTGMSFRRFLIFDGVGSLLYSSSGIILGFVFSKELHQGMALLSRLGVGACGLVLIVIFGYIVFKLFRWRRDRAKPQTVPNRFEGGASQSIPADKALVGESTHFMETANRIRETREIGIRGIPSLKPKLASTKALASASDLSLSWQRGITWF